MKFSKITLIGAILSFLLTSTACANHLKSDVVYFLPPVHLLDDIQKPDTTNIKTQGNMLEHIGKLYDAIDLKNADLYVLREYRVNCLRMSKENN